MGIQRIVIAPIILQWSEWVPWEKRLTDARSDPEGVTPPHQPGVYEAKLLDADARLTIGKAADLRRRVKRGLVQAKLPHSSGKDIRALEDTSQVVIRWAITERPAAVEEELHLQHIKDLGGLPKYTDRT